MKTSSPNFLALWTNDLRAGIAANLARMARRRNPVHQLAALQQQKQEADKAPLSLFFMGGAGAPSLKLQRTSAPE
jgi:hypothetical protein